MDGNELSRSKNASVTNPGQGIFCISVPGISSKDTPILVPPGDQGDVELDNASVDLLNNEVHAGSMETAFVVWYQFSENCPTGTWEVVTYHSYWEEFNFEDGFYYNIDLEDEPFSFVVP